MGEKMKSKLQDHRRARGVDLEQLQAQVYLQQLRKRLHAHGEHAVIKGRRVA